MYLVEDECILAPAVQQLHNLWAEIRMLCPSTPRGCREAELNRTSELYAWKTEGLGCMTRLWIPFMQPLYFGLTAPRRVESS